MGYITQTTLTPPGQTLSSPPPSNKNEWVHPVISEPQPKIQLTQSFYKVTSFLDFQPFLKGFQSVFQYLYDLMKYLNNPEYFQRLICDTHEIQGKSRELLGFRYIDHSDLYYSICGMLHVWYITGRQQM